MSKRKKLASGTVRAERPLWTKYGLVWLVADNWQAIDNVLRAIFTTQKTTLGGTLKSKSVDSKRRGA